MVRIQLRYLDEATFLQRFAPNVTRGGIFLASRAPHPIGTVITFEVAILQGPPLLSGTGKVTWVREFSPAEPHRAHGMGVQFLELSPASRQMLDKLLTHKTLPPRLTPGAAVPAGGVASGGPRRPTPLPAGADAEAATWIDDQGVKQAVDRARSLVCKVDEELEALLVRDRSMSPSPDEALSELPRLLGLRRQ